jgi:excinuclease ABC subunit A
MQDSRSATKGLPVIRVRGARVHNLQNVDLDLPRDKLTVITGVSGSGKSSLAFDTIYAEGQRQYIESLSTYARQFLDQLERPDVDSVDGLEPTLCIDQTAGSTNPRSTVATVTEIYDYLRLLFARAGTPHCPQCGQAILQQSPDEIVGALQDFAEGTKLVILSPKVRGRKGAHQDVFAEIRKAGLVRVRVDGAMMPLDDVPPLAPRKNHTIEAVVDRIVVRPGSNDRVADSIRLALQISDGLVTLVTQPPGESEWHDRLISTRYACPNCDLSFDELEPRTFSFNSPYGACPHCDGMGRLASGEDTVECPHCHGGRLRPEALAVTFAGANIQQTTALPISEAATHFKSLDLSGTVAEIANPILSEVGKRIDFLVKVGVGYLTLDRAADSLSGGELQRVRLATSIGSGLIGICYVLDEPSIGLHQSDNDRLISAIRDLQQSGNTVLVVEHDEAIMRSADWLIDMGPGAGRNGGHVMAVGTPDQVAENEQSNTGKYLSGKSRIDVPTRRQPDPNRRIRLTGVTTNNLKSVDVEFPLGLMIGVSGVSGSGKSSLINDTLFPAVARQLKLSSPTPGPHKHLTGVEEIEKLIPIDQSPIGRSPRSCPATFTGVFDEIRKIFATTREAKQKGFTASRFSFNAGAGRCAQCQGQGQEKIEMNFLSDLYVTCTACGGKRFNQQTLRVRFKLASIADVLAMTVDEAADFFANFAKVSRFLDALRAVGLGYLSLGQSSTTLSGGEAQRLKLATELARTETGKTLYVLDEPTTGLHFDDIRRLLGVLNSLVDRGNTVIVIEHQLDVIKCCDWVIDIGPAGGAAGGNILASGPPETVAKIEASITGRYLRPLLELA